MPRLPLQTGFIQASLQAYQAKQEAEITPLTIFVSNLVAGHPRH